MTTGKILKKIREKNKLTQVDVSEKLRFHAQYINMLENDRQGMPVEHFDRFMDAYGFSQPERAEMALHLALGGRINHQTIKYLNLEAKKIPKKEIEKYSVRKDAK